MFRATGAGITPEKWPEYFVQGLGKTNWHKSTAHKMNDDKTMLVHSTIFEDYLPEALQDDEDHNLGGGPPVLLEDAW